VVFWVLPDAVVPMLFCPMLVEAVDPVDFCVGAALLDCAAARLVDNRRAATPAMTFFSMKMLR
jgi:hypothetical protein